MTKEEIQKYEKETEIVLMGDTHAGNKQSHNKHLKYIKKFFKRNKKHNIYFRFMGDWTVKNN